MWPINTKVVSIATVLGYLVPLTLLWLLGILLTRFGHQGALDTYAVLTLLYLFAIAPVLTSYLAARRAPTLPIYHGILAVSLSMLLLFLKGDLQPLWVIPWSIALSYIGARRFKNEGKL
jgi:hypothetical protein